MWKTLEADQGGTSNSATGKANKNYHSKRLDLVRAIAIVFVVLCHATEGVYSFNLENISTLSVLSKTFCFLSFTCGRLGVPLFLMLTGSLLLTRDYDEKSIKRFWMNKWLHLLICTVIWFSIYDIFLTFYSHTSISWLQYIEEMLFFRKVNMSHTWYMTMILGMYILLPFVSNILKNYDTKIFIFPLVIFSFYSFGFTTINVINKVLNPKMPLSNQFSLGFCGGVYGLYILLGYFVRNGFLKRVGTIIIAFVTLAATGSVIVIQLLSYQRGIAYNVWYDNLFLFIASMGIFELCSRLNHVYCYRVINLISRYSFPVYLIHNIVKALLIPYLNHIALIMPIKVFMLWIACFTISLILSILVSKIPWFGKYILYLK